MVAAAGLVSSGVTVSLSEPLKTRVRIDVPEPAVHYMTMMTDVDIGSGSVRFAKDYVGVDYHNDGHSHIDAFSHVAFEGALYDDEPADARDRTGRGGGRDRHPRGRARGPCRPARRTRGSRRALDRAR